MATTPNVPKSFGEAPALTDKQLELLSEVSELEQLDALQYWKSVVPSVFANILDAKEVREDG
jgi:hypothetical protein